MAALKPLGVLREMLGILCGPEGTVSSSFSQPVIIDSGVGGAGFP